MGWEIDDHRIKSSPYVFVLEVLELLKDLDLQILLAIVLPEVLRVDIHDIIQFDLH